jgi:very-short-patch-repair endonuclease
MRRRVPEEMTSRARALRTNATEAERSLWRQLSRYRPRFTRQLVIGPYIVDLACREARLVVEVDGGQHAEQASYDAARSTWLEQQGWRVIRLWNSDVLGNPEGAAQHVLTEAAECLGGTHPQPLPCREGKHHAGLRNL